MDNQNGSEKKADQVSDTVREEIEDIDREEQFEETTNSEVDEPTEEEIKAINIAIVDGELKIDDVKGTGSTSIKKAIAAKSTKTRQAKLKAKKEILAKDLHLEDLQDEVIVKPRKRGPTIKSLKEEMEKMALKHAEDLKAQIVAREEEGRKLQAIIDNLVASVAELKAPKPKPTNNKSPEQLRLEAEIERKRRQLYGV